MNDHPVVLEQRIQPIAIFGNKIGFMAHTGKSGMASRMVKKAYFRF
ncbi:MAG: hypothetical protein R2822_22485 [Spirosomataceae bacterium]